MQIIPASSLWSSCLAKNTSAPASPPPESLPVAPPLSPPPPAAMPPIVASPPAVMAPPASPACTAEFAVQGPYEEVDNIGLRPEKPGDLGFQTPLQCILLLSHAGFLKQRVCCDGICTLASHAATPVLIDFKAHSVEWAHSYVYFPSMLDTKHSFHQFSRVSPLHFAIGGAVPSNAYPYFDKHS